MSFPMLATELDVMANGGRTHRLYLNVAHTDCPGLFVVGLMKPQGAGIPMMQAQAELIADVIQVGGSGIPW